MPRFRVSGVSFGSVDHFIFIYLEFIPSRVSRSLRRRKHRPHPSRIDFFFFTNAPCKGWPCKWPHRLLPEIYDVPFWPFLSQYFIFGFTLAARTGRRGTVLCLWQEGDDPFAPSTTRPHNLHSFSRKNLQSTIKIPFPTLYLNKKNYPSYDGRPTSSGVAKICRSPVIAFLHWTAGPASVL